jgi:hypothetical protein
MLQKSQEKMLKIIFQQNLIAYKLAAPIRPNLKVPMEGFLIISLLLTGGPVRQHLLKFRLRWKIYEEQIL